MDGRISGRLSNSVHNDESVESVESVHMLIRGTGFEDEFKVGLGARELFKLGEGKMLKVPVGEVILPFVLFEFFEALMSADIDGGC